MPPEICFLKSRMTKFNVSYFANYLSIYFLFLEKFSLDDPINTRLNYEKLILSVESLKELFFAVSIKHDPNLRKIMVVTRCWRFFVISIPKIKGIDSVRIVSIYFSISNRCSSYSASCPVGRFILLQ